MLRQKKNAEISKPLHFCICIAAMDWDTMKENAQPMKRGYTVSTITQILKEQPSLQEIEAERQFVYLIASFVSFS